MRTRVVWLAVFFLIGFIVSVPSLAQDEVENIMINGGFEDGITDPWGGYGGATQEVVDKLDGAAVPEDPIEGNFCLHVVVAAAGANWWDLGLDQSGHVFEKGKKYTLSAFLKCKEGTLDINFKPELGQDPWTGYGEEIITMTDEWAEYSITTPVFSEDVSPATITFHIGFAAAEFWIDGVRFYEGDYAPPFLGDKSFASRPVPEDGAIHPDTWVNISWKPGDFAVSHDVYFGDNFDDVSAGAEGTFVGNQGDTFIIVGFPGFPIPDGLVPGTTYYWRIDEVNDLDPNSPWKGDVWSFSIPPKTAYFPNPPDGADSVNPNVELSWTEGFGAKLHTVYFGDNFDDVNNAAGGLPQGTKDYTPSILKMAKTYYWRVDEFDVIETHKGDVWSFTTEGAVGSPEPSNGTVDVTQTPVLTWIPGVNGASHEVYFGSDKDAVNNADTGSPEYKGSGNLGSESYNPGHLEWGTTYYWRVDEANNANADSPWTGPLWSFTTANFLILDDFESYNDLDPAEPGSKNIFYTWIDGYDNPAINGALVGNEFPPYAEQTIVHGGLQSMPMSYDNAVGKSEATLTLTDMRDWTVKGVNTLTIWFRGDSANAAETMYVVLNGSAGVDNDNPNAAQIDAWTRWNIDLQAFGVNLANINTITLGFGNRSNPVAGGAGMMYFDDIRLYAPAP